MDVPTIRTKFKDLVSRQVYNKKWDKLSATQQNKLRSEHRKQFEFLAKKYPGESLLEYNRRFTMSDRGDHDLLIEINTTLKELKVDFDNHLVHHFRYNILAWSIAAGAIVTLAIALIKVL